MAEGSGRQAALCNKLQQRGACFDIHLSLQSHWGGYVPAQLVLKPET
jgi:hypothetical protein